MDIDFSNILMQRGTTAFGIDSCSCSVIKAGPVPGFGCHVLGWCQIRCQSGHQAWSPSHSRREARASLWCIVGGFHRRETLDSWWIESHTRLWLYQCGSAQVRSVCTLWAVNPTLSPSYAILANLACRCSQMCHKIVPFSLVFSFSVAAATSFFLGECRHCCCDGGCFGLGPSAPGDLFSSPHRRRPSPNTPLPSSLFSS